MGLLSNLFGSKKTSQPDAADLVVALENKISDHTKKYGEKPETIFIDGDIHMRLANAGFYANVAKHGIFKGVRFCPMGIPDGLIWMTDKDWFAHPEYKKSATSVIMEKDIWAHKE